MKHLKTFENYSVNEEFWGLSKDERTESKKQKLQAELDRLVPVWTRKGTIKKPTQEVLDQFWSDAEADGYKGLPGIKDRNYPTEIVYRNADSIKWGGAGGHAFGSGE